MWIKIKTTSRYYTTKIGFHNNLFRFFLLPGESGKNPEEFQVEHSFVQKVMDLFVEEVNKSKKDFQDEINEEAQKFQTILKALSSMDNKITTISEQIESLTNRKKI